VEAAWKSEQLPLSFFSKLCYIIQWYFVETHLNTPAGTPQDRT
jgi:hypothetical protein